LQIFWKDEKKEKSDQRNKGFNPPFNQNSPNKNHQYQSTKQESKKEDSLGKRGRPPIHFFGYNKYHMYKYFPHKGDKMKTMHKIQEATIVEDMGRSIPRIYVSLEDRQEKFQSHMIEVEGNIINQPIVILIDSGLSHCYIDPKLVDRIHLDKINLDKKMFGLVIHWNRKKDQ
jgi:hypothetical protein